MDIAWPALVILVMLLPGFFFFVGIYSRELYGRDASSRDAISKLAPIVIVAFFTNAALIAVIERISFLPHVDFEVLLSSVNLDAEGSVGIPALASNLRANALWILSYEAAACALGAAAGRLMGKLVISGKWKLGVAHPWAYELTADSERRLNPTYAFVLSKIRRGNAYELYRGALDRFGLHADGRFAHLVLLQPEKCKVTRTADGITKDFHWTAVGESTGLAVQQRLLYVDMANVANVVFEQYPTIVGITPGQISDLLKEIRDRASSPS